MFAVANYYATCKKILANSFAKIYVRRERPLEVGRFLPANEFSGEPFASSRRSARELGRTRANSADFRRTFGVLRRTSGGVRRTVGVGEPLASSRGVRASSLEFARVRAGSRRTTVRRVYCLKPKNFLKKFEIWVKKSQYCPKISEIDLDFFRLFLT